MDEFGPQLAPAVLETCRASGPQASQALSRAFKAPLELTGGEADHVRFDAMPAELSGPGLVVLMPVGAKAALLLIPDSSELLPSWYRRPKATEIGRLATLSQELGKLLLPDEWAARDCVAAAVGDLLQALKRCDCADGAARIRMTLTGLGRNPANVSLVWPIENPAEVFDALPVSAAAPTKPNGDDDLRFESLPRYSRSLLRIKVPVMVTLAAKKQPVSNIVELVPGSIIQFEKSCEETLELEVGAQRIAHGECVKVGDKFGLRITALILPAERFESIAPVGG